MKQVLAVILLFVASTAYAGDPPYIGATSCDASSNCGYATGNGIVKHAIDYAIESVCNGDVNNCNVHLPDGVKVHVIDSSGGIPSDVRVAVETVLGVVRFTFWGEGGLYSCPHDPLFHVCQIAPNSKVCRNREF